jgi:sugar lactone lactonase YvrE
LSAAFHGAVGLAFAANGDLYVAEQSANKIRKISGDSVTTFIQGGGPATSYVAMPTDLCIDGAGNFYVGDDLHLQIKKISPGGQVSVIAGLDGYQASVNGPALNAGFVSPEGLLLAPSGTLFVADWHRIRQLSNGTVSTFAGSTGDFRDGTGTDASFNLPGCMARDGEGNLYVTDPGNNLVRMITPAGVVTTLAGSPKVKGYADGTGMNALFSRANGIVIDKSGVLYVSDWGNNCIRRITVK